MTAYRRLWLPLVMTTAVSLAYAGPSGTDILKRSLDLTAQVRDYTAKVRVTASLPGVSIAPRNATVYFKRPDKVHIESREVVILPRRALALGSFGTELTRKAKVLLVSKTLRGTVPYYFLKILPQAKQGTSDRLLIWIRGDRWTVERMEAYAAGKRELAVRWEYALVGGKYWMPKRLVATVPGRAGSRHPGPRPQAARPTGEGTVTVELSDMRVNTGLADSLFEEKQAR